MDMIEKERVCVACNGVLAGFSFDHAIDETIHLFAVCLNKKCRLFWVFQIGKEKDK